MKKTHFSLFGAAAGSLFLFTNSGFAQGTAFTYQGRLNAGGVAATGNFDFQFSLFNAATNGTEAGPALTNLDVGVSSGLFVVTLDFGNVFNGTPMWLNIGVRTNGSTGAFTPLLPLQPLTPTPYAEYTATAGSVAEGAVSAPQLNTPSGPASGQVLGFSGSSLEWMSPAASSGAWSLTGNSGTSPGTDFLGPTDNEPLLFKANGIDALYLLGNANGSVNISGGYFAGVALNAYGVTDFGGGEGGANTVYPNYATVSGGFDNSINPGGIYGTIPGGYGNFVNGAYSLAAGSQALATNANVFVWSDGSGGAFGSTANNQFSVHATGGVRFVTGGAGMTIDGVAVSTGGGGGGSGWSLTGNAGTTPGPNFLGTTDDSALELHVNGTRAFRLEPGSDGLPNVNGGGNNSTATAGGAATVAGGYGNTASGVGATVGGGGYDGTTYAGNTASGAASVIAGGMGNSAFYYGAVGGGQDNAASGYNSAVVGGYNNSATTTGAFVGGGYDNTASGFASTVPGGLDSVASGGYSFAAGDSAVAAHSGAFVWADASSGSQFSSTANNQFNVRAMGGVRFVTGGAGMTIDGVAVATGGGGGGDGSTNGWLTTGNAGANPALGYFLGTTDTNGLELAVDGLQGMRLDYVAAYTAVPYTATTSINVTVGFWSNANGAGVLGGTIAGGGYSYQNGFNFYNYPNSVTGDFGTVGGGAGNTAGYEATVPGGYDNSATGTGSLAAGVNAHTSYNGNFVWGDGTQAANGTGANRFDVLATGGVNFFTSTVNCITSGGGLWVGNGSVGINTTTPSEALEVNGEFIMVDGVGGEQCYIGNDGYGGDVQVGSLTSGITAVSLYNNTDGAYMHLYCSSITVEGGADLAEPFEISDPGAPIPQGAVVVIDKEKPGQLKMSSQPYDTRVAGVVSGANGINPGIQMQQQALLEGGKNVALTGRVYVQADASNGAIEPGDLLTTSSTPGHAMKVMDHARAAGAILGKAMTGLSAGKGMVLVLVTLQ